VVDRKLCNHLIRLRIDAERCGSRHDPDAAMTNPDGVRTLSDWDPREGKRPIGTEPEAREERFKLQIRGNRRWPRGTQLRISHVNRVGGPLRMEASNGSRRDDPSAKCGPGRCRCLPGQVISHAVRAERTIHGDLRIQGEATVD
jgi:hypothetical protein